jgi:hypothetical protein
MLVTDFTQPAQADQSSAQRVTFELASLLESSDPVKCPITKYSFHKAVNPGGTEVFSLAWLSVDESTGQVALSNYAGTSLGVWSLFFKAFNEMNEFKEFNTQVVQQLVFRYTDCSQGNFSIDSSIGANEVVVKQISHQNVDNQIISHSRDHQQY